jgi:hypothetical protein
MTRRITPRDPIAAEQRKATAARRAGRNAQCACGEHRPEALNTKSTPIICEHCKRKKKGKTTMDDHHVAGRANSPKTIQVPVNDHRARLSVDQYDWPGHTLENPDASPLLRGAASIRGFVDTAVFLIEEFLLWIAEMLETLDDNLRERLGSKWWCDTAVEMFAPKGDSHVTQ